MDRWTSGDWDVTCLTDGEIEIPAEALPWLGSSTPIGLTVNAFLLEGEAGKVLVDAGCGSLWGAKAGHLIGALAQRGIGADDIALVIFSHLHSDRCGGALAGETAAFGKAEIVLAAAEAAAMEGTKSAGGRVLLAYAGRTRLTHGADEILPGLSTWPLPGHSPGHMALRVGPDLVLTGDLMHFPQQIADTTLGTIYDTDKAQASDSRKRALSEIAERDLVVSGGHFRSPHLFQRIRADGAGFAAVPA